MKKLLLAAVAVVALAAPANAEFVLNDNVFADLGATGFGNAPRLLTLQNSPFQNGAVVSTNGITTFLNDISIGAAPTFAVTGTVCGLGNIGSCSTGLVPNQSNLVNVTTLWETGADVGVGLDTNQLGAAQAAPLLFTELVLNIYKADGTLIGTFGGNDPVLISVAQLALQQGNGNSVFNLNLTAGEQAEFDAMRAANPGLIFAGLAAAFGCSPAPCIGASNDGADSFLAFDAQAVPGPIVGAGLPGLIMACGMMIGLARRRRRLNAA